MRQPSIENQRLKVAKLKGQVAKLAVKQVELEAAEAIFVKLTSSESQDERIKRLEALRAEEAKLAAEVAEIENSRTVETSTDTEVMDTEDTDSD